MKKQHLAHLDHLEKPSIAWIEPLVKITFFKNNEIIAIFKYKTFFRTYVGWVKFFVTISSYIQSSKMSDILDIVSGLIEVRKPTDSNRSTPLSHIGKIPLNFVITNKFGISALTTLLVRTEYLISSENVTEKQQGTWFNFVVSLADAISGCNNASTPLESVPIQIFNKHCNRIVSLTSDKRLTLEKQIVDSSLLNSWKTYFYFMRNFYSMKNFYFMKNLFVIHKRFASFVNSINSAENVSRIA